ncbi:acyl-CoA-like ligand-binding transcription factor [Arthrobacter globiformis]|uniref:acyl-CoA-like ligand-binding transcription factor n=1 Tax=Arthrobacter globiformis TaxID=1665 RepID=UPI0035933391
MLPRAIGHGSLALALSAYEQRLESADASSAELIDAATADLVRTRELISTDSQSCLSSSP